MLCCVIFKTNRRREERVWPFVRPCQGQWMFLSNPEVVWPLSFLVFALSLSLSILKRFKKRTSRWITFPESCRHVRSSSRILTFWQTRFLYGKHKKEELYKKECTFQPEVSFWRHLRSITSSPPPLPFLTSSWSFHLSLSLSSADDNEVQRTRLRVFWWMTDQIARTFSDYRERERERRKERDRERERDTMRCERVK
jgi:hypothetical protein